MGNGLPGFKLIKLFLLALTRRHEKALTGRLSFVFLFFCVSNFDSFLRWKTTSARFLV